MRRATGGTRGQERRRGSVKADAHRAGGHRPRGRGSRREGKSRSGHTSSPTVGTRIKDKEGATVWKVVSVGVKRTGYGHGTKYTVG